MSFGKVKLNDGTKVRGLLSIRIDELEGVHAVLLALITVVDSCYRFWYRVDNEVPGLTLL